MYKTKTFKSDHTRFFYGKDLNFFSPQTFKLSITTKIDTNKENSMIIIDDVFKTHVAADVYTKKLATDKGTNWL